MSLQNEKFRELIFQLLYSQDMGKATPTDMHPMLMKELQVTKKAVLTAQAIVDKIMALLPSIDALLSQTSTDYPLERIHSVERNILRLAIYEMLYDQNIPPKVAISEAIRLTKKFSTKEAMTFVNAIMDHIYKELADDSKLH